MQGYYERLEFFEQIDEYIKILRYFNNFLNIDKNESSQQLMDILIGFNIFFKVLEEKIGYLFITELLAEIEFSSDTLQIFLNHNIPLKHQEILGIPIQDFIEELNEYPASADFSWISRH